MKLKSITRLQEEIITAKKKYKLLQDEYLRILGTETDKFIRSGNSDIEAYINKITQIKKTFYGE
jgi:hypothetical protein